MCYLTNDKALGLALKVAKKIRELSSESNKVIRIYGVPRGGVPAAYLVASCSIHIIVCDHLDEADFIVDDIIDSGATKARYEETNPAIPFLALIDKTDPDCIYLNEWIVFPWEVTDMGHNESIEENVTRILQYIGEDVKRGGLLDTPKRVAKAWGEWCSGYKLKAEDILKVFEDGAENCDEMVVRKDIPIYSHCEHHLAAIIGVCTIAYIPDGKIVGLSKMDRLADMFARRLQVQERLGNQIADAMFDILKPKGVGVWISARHLCVESRGVRNQNSETVTCALRGVFRTQPETRAEFLALNRGS